MEDVQFSTFNALCRGSGIKVKNFRTDTTLTALLMQRNSFISELINDILEKTIPFGIPQYLMDSHHSMLFKHYEKKIVKDPKVLKVDDLSFGFVLWLGACGISFCGFILEIVMFKVRKWMRTVVGIWMVLRILFMRLRTVVL